MLVLFCMLLCYLFHLCFCVLYYSKYALFASSYLFEKIFTAPCSFSIPLNPLNSFPSFIIFIHLTPAGSCFCFVFLFAHISFCSFSRIDVRRFHLYIFLLNRQCAILFMYIIDIYLNGLLFYALCSFCFCFSIAIRRS